MPRWFSQQKKILTQTIFIYIKKYTFKVLLYYLSYLMYNLLSSVGFYLIMIFIIFSIGLSGLILNRSDILRSIVYIELLLLSINLIFIVSAIFLDDSLGIIAVLFILAIAAAETAIGLSLLIACYLLQRDILFSIIKSSKVKI